MFDNQPNVATRREFINVSGLIARIPNNANDERGLLGMAFHPDYPTQSARVSFYTANAPVALVSRVLEFQTRDGGQTLDPSSAVTILQTYQPEANHNGGNIAFGPDGFLYIGIGDGGGGGDQHGTIGNGQRLTTLLGKMLRIDVYGTTGCHALRHSGRQSLRRQRALQRTAPARHGELPGDLRLWLPQSLALELRPRQRRAVGGRCRAGRLGGSGPW